METKSSSLFYTSFVYRLEYGWFSAIKEGFDSLTRCQYITTAARVTVRFKKTALIYVGVA